MALSAPVIEAYAQELLRAERDAVAVLPLTERHPGLTVPEAYEIQRRGRALRITEGMGLVGRKVGLTSKAMQELLGVGEPDFGYLTEAMVHENGVKLSAAALVAPRVEAEIALRLRRPLAGATVDRATALAAIGEIAPALEIVDSRIADWRIKLADTIADNASSGHAVIGRFRPLADHKLEDIEMTMTVTREDGSTATASGRGAAVLGHPAEALAWLARTLAPFDEGLAAGEIVIPGAMAAAVPITAGDRVTASFTVLGEVGTQFSA